MRRTRRDAIRVGIFVLLAGALLIGGLLWIAGSSFLRPVDGYEVLFDRSVSGLNAGADVQYQGVVVGRVRDIRLTHDIPPKVAVAVELTPGTPVQTDTTAALVGSLVTGIRFIELQGGTETAGRLEPGGWIPGTVPSLEKLGGSLQTIADRVDGLLENLQDKVFTDTNAEKLTGMVSDLHSVVHKLDATMNLFQAQETGKDLADLVHEASRVAKNANEALGDFQGRRAGLYGGLDTALRELGAAAQQTRDLASRTQSELATTAGSIETLLVELTRTADRLREAVDVIGSDPGVLLRGRPVPEREFAE